VWWPAITVSRHVSRSSTTFLSTAASDMALWMGDGQAVLFVHDACIGDVCWGLVWVMLVRAECVRVVDIIIIIIIIEREREAPAAS
jgi:hypothetical protein